MTASAVVASFVALAAPRPANAIFCANCSTAVQQLIGYAKQIEQAATELQQLQQQIMMYKNMVTNTVALPMQAWSMAQGDIMQVQSLSNLGNIMGGNSGSIITRLGSADGYLNQVESIGSIPGQLTMWQETMGNNLKSLGRMLGMQQDQVNNNAALLTTLQNHATSAQGQMQALEAGNELAGAQAAQLMQVHQTLIALSQEIATRDAVNADRQARDDETLRQYVTSPAVPTGGYQAW